MMTQPQTALVTGASGGIGYEFVQILAAQGFNLILVARSEDKLKQIARNLEQTHAIQATVIAQDLSLPNSPQELYEAVQAKNLSVDVLINNAGFANYGHFVESDLQKELNMIQVNVTTLTHLSKLFARQMVQRGRGRIMNVASTAAFQPGPLMAVYYATKAYVLSFSEALANELQGTGVWVTALCPGPTQSGFQSRAAMEDSKLVKDQEIMSATTVAEIGLAGLMDGKTLVIPGLKNQILSLTPRFVPRKITTQIVRSMQEEAH